MQHNASFTAGIINKGTEAKLQWQGASFALEFTYDEGFEFEQVIPVNSLSAVQQQMVLAKQPEADKIIIEGVSKFYGKTYEVYYFERGVA